MHLGEGKWRFYLGVDISNVRNLVPNRFLVKRSITRLLTSGSACQKSLAQNLIHLWQPYRAQMKDNPNLWIGPSPRYLHTACSIRTGQRSQHTPRVAFSGCCCTARTLQRLDRPGTGPFGDAYVPLRVTRLSAFGERSPHPCSSGTLMAASESPISPGLNRLFL
jgi:hypothetical protein